MPPKAKPKATKEKKAPLPRDEFYCLGDRQYVKGKNITEELINGRPCLRATCPLNPNHRLFKFISEGKKK